MERIVIEVDDATAKKWKESSPEVKKEIGFSFQNLFDETSREIKIAQFESLLDKASDEAERNGLTEEILQKLLNEE
jgi:hypothetical protein